MVVWLIGSSFHAWAQNSEPKHAMQANAAPALEKGPPKTWVDADTGHRVFRLSNELNSRDIYFNQNAFTPDGKKMVYLSPKGLFVLDMTTKESHLLVAGLIHSIVVGTKTQRVFFMKREDRQLYVADVDSGQVTQLAEMPKRASFNTINADETLLGGTYIENDGADYSEIRQSNVNISSSSARKQRFNSHLPEALFTYDLRNGHITVVLHGTDWLNHVLFSPIDPTLLMYCHEGPGIAVDRIWTIRTDGTKNMLVHARTAEDEYVSHEFWSRDGKTIWYDLQKPRGTEFYLASYDVVAGKRRWYHLNKLDSSRHFYGAIDDSVFCGDGDDRFPNGTHHKWIELFHPAVNNAPTLGNDAEYGRLPSENLVNMTKHNYALEPNARFSPDDKLVIFTSNMFGPSYVFAVEVAPASTN